MWNRWRGYEMGLGRRGGGIRVQLEQLNCEEKY